MLLLPRVCSALPFNDDMVNSQVKVGQIARPPVPGTIAHGSLVSRYESKAEAAQAKNPIGDDKGSVVRGKRLFAINCYNCHGTPMKEGYKPGPVGSFVPGPNLADPMYHADKKTDGDIFATMYFGGLFLMEPLGWKLTTGEAWSIVNYIRSVQAGG